MIYLLLKHEGSYEDSHTTIVCYSLDKSKLDVRIAILNEQKQKLYDANIALTKFDKTYYNHSEGFHYEIKEVEEIKDTHIEIQYEVEE